jgi:haloalkane dehalogenase
VDLVVRTPESCFVDLPGYGFEARYAEISDKVGTLRMAYVDEGPPDDDPVLLLHGQPTWSFLYRKVIPVLVERGHRAIAVDNIGFGRSDKITDPFSYTLDLQIERMTRFIEALDLQRITLFGQDWGGPIGFGTLAARPDRFARVVAGNTILHTFDPALRDTLRWAQYPIDDGERVVVQTALVEWARLSYQVRDFRPGEIISAITAEPLSPAEVAAYNAPFPEEIYRTGLRQTNAMIALTPGHPTTATGKRIWSTLHGWDRPFMTVWGGEDQATQGWEKVFQDQVPGAAGQAHEVLDHCNHFMQEDQGPTVGRLIADFIDKNPAP